MCYYQYQASATAEVASATNITNVDVCANWALLSMRVTSSSEAAAVPLGEGEYPSAVPLGAVEDPADLPSGEGEDPAALPSGEGEDPAAPLPGEGVAITLLGLGVEVTLFAGHAVPLSSGVVHFGSPRGPTAPKRQRSEVSWVEEEACNVFGQSPPSSGVP